MKKLINILLILASLAMAIYPISYSLMQFKYIIPSIILLLIILGIMHLLNKLKLNTKYNCLLIFIFTFIIRLLVILFFENSVSQISDFEIAYNTSINMTFDYRIYYSVFPHWIMYPSIVHFLYGIFGEYQIVGLIFNVITNAVTSILIYLISLKVFKSEKKSLLASFLYIFYISNIFYVVIYTQEHLGSMLLMLGLYLFLISVDSNSTKNKILLMISSGSIFGISVLFKNFAPVFIIAFVGYIFLMFILKEININQIYKYIVGFTLLILSYSISNQLIYNTADYITGYKVNRDSAPCYLNVGLHSSGWGGYSHDLYYYYFDLVEKNNYNFEKTNDIVMTDLRYNILHNYRGLKYKLNTKAKVIAKDDEAKMFWSKLSFSDKKISDSIYKLNYFASGFYYLLNILLAIALVILYLRKNYKGYLLAAIIFGSYLLLLLIEAQGRYRYSIEPLYFMLSAYSLSYIYDNISKKFKFKIRSSK